MKNQKSGNRIFRLKSKSTPLSFILSSKSSKLRPLLHFDGKQNRPLRYARNQKSPFEDEQDGNAILEPIVFEDGMLVVPANNPVLQQFLDLHPDKGRLFVEVDHEKDAQAELERIDTQADAIVKAKGLTLEQMESLARVLLGINPDKLSTSELKRDILVFARNYPQEFLEAEEDPELDLSGKVALFFEKNLLSTRNENRDVYYNLTKNKKKMLSVPYGQDYQKVVASYLMSDEGLESLMTLERVLEAK